MTSSVREKMMQVVKEKKLVRRALMVADKVNKELDAAKEMVRARDEKGHYIADDPATPENEAWVEKAVTAVKKTVAKKQPAKKKKSTKKV
jgi:hypothetical protein